MTVLYKKLRLWCGLGLCLSLYATYVELKAEHDKNYKAFCDLSPKISCTAVFNSPYGKSFGFIYHIFGNSFDKWNPHNGILGILYYLTFILTTFYHHPFLSIFHVVGCIISNLLSFYLAYLLYFILDDFCVVCVCIYIVNFFCLRELYNIYKKLFLSKKDYFNKRND